MGSSSIKEPFSVDFASRGLPISLFQMLREVIAGGGGDGQMKDVVGGKWRDGGMSVGDLIVKFTKVSLVKFSPMKTLILNLSPTDRETSRLNFTFTIKRSLT